MPPNLSPRRPTIGLAGAALLAAIAAAIVAAVVAAVLGPATARTTSRPPPAGPSAGGQLGGRTHDRRSPADPTIAPPLSTWAPTDRAQVLHAYLRFWQIAQTVDRRPSNQWRPTLEPVTGQPLLDQLLDGFAAQQAHRTLQYGTVDPHPTLADLTADRASILDCQDASRSGEINRDTGIIQKAGSAHTAVAAVLRRDGHGTWRVTEARYLPDPC